MLRCRRARVHAYTSLTNASHCIPFADLISVCRCSNPRIPTTFFGRLPELVQRRCLLNSRSRKRHERSNRSSSATHFLAGYISRKIAGLISQRSRVRFALPQPLLFCFVRLAVRTLGFLLRYAGSIPARSANTSHYKRD